MLLPRAGRTPKWLSQAGDHRAYCPPSAHRGPILPRDTYPKHRECEQQDQQHAGAGGLPWASHSWKHPSAVPSTGVPD